jgi:hypothetical protein
MFNVLTICLYIELFDTRFVSRSGWFRPASYTDLFGILNELGDTKSTFVVGNTGGSVAWKYPPANPADSARVKIDISRIPELLVVIEHGSRRSLIDSHKKHFVFSFSFFDR